MGNDHDRDFKRGVFLLDCCVAREYATLFMMGG
jgi:hypothetical protein